MEDMSFDGTNDTLKEGENRAAEEQTPETEPDTGFRKILKKLPVITVPGILALLALVAVFGTAVAYSTHRFHMASSWAHSPYIGFKNYDYFAGSNAWQVIGNTLLVRLLALAVCGALAALMCLVYRKMKKPGTILTTACVWLIPAALPTAVMAIAARGLLINLRLIQNSLLYLASAGLQVLGIFCFTCGLFAYLKKNPFSGLLVSALVWLLGSLSTNAVSFYMLGFGPTDLYLDDMIFMMTANLSMDLYRSSAISVIKVLLQVLIGIIPAVLLCRSMRKETPLRRKTTRAELWLIPAAVVCAALAVLAVDPVRAMKDNLVRTGINSLLLTLSGGAIGGLIAYSLIRLLRNASAAVYGSAALILSAAMSFVGVQIMINVRLRMMDTIQFHALAAAFDWRVILLTVILSFALRTRTEKHPVCLALALMLLVGAYTWTKVDFAQVHETVRGLTTGKLFLTYILGKIDAGAPQQWTKIISTVPPLLLGAGGAFLMRQAFRDKEEAI